MARSLFGRRRSASRSSAHPTLTEATVITLRLATRPEDLAVAELAALNEDVPPCGRALVAEVDGRARAALSLENDRVLADPFYPADELSSLLSLRRSQLAASRRDGPAGLVS